MIARHTVGVNKTRWNVFTTSSLDYSGAREGKARRILFAERFRLRFIKNSARLIWNWLIDPWKCLAADSNLPSRLLTRMEGGSGKNEGRSWWQGNEHVAF